MGSVRVRDTRASRKSRVRRLDSVIRPIARQSQPEKGMVRRQDSPGKARIVPSQASAAPSRYRRVTTCDQQGIAPVAIAAGHRSMTTELDVR